MFKAATNCVLKLSDCWIQGSCMETFFKISDLASETL